MVRVHALGNQKPKEQRSHIGNQIRCLLLRVEAAHDQIGLRANGPRRKNVYFGKDPTFSILARIAGMVIADIGGDYLPFVNQLPADGNLIAAIGPLSVLHLRRMSPDS